MKIQNENTDLKIGYCLEVHDLAASKLAAGREKDWPFVQTMLQHHIIDAAELQKRLDVLPVTPAQRGRLSAWLLKQT